MGQLILRGMDMLPVILKQYNKILLVHGKAFGQHPIKSLFPSASTVSFADFAPNPRYEDVCKGIDLFNGAGCDAIAAVGGGSAMDVAKCVKLFCRMDKNINYLRQEKRDTGIPLVAVPTTAGTGSESTQHAVIYYKGEKQSVSHPGIIPEYVFLIPSLLKGLPEYQKKCTMMDALCQAIESWWSINSTDESREYSRRAVSEIMENWEGYIFGNTEEASEKMLEAANYAGRAINITATTAPHAMSYKLTTLYNIPHGHAVAVCLPEVWGYMLEHGECCVDGRGAEYLKDTLNQIASFLTLDDFKSMLHRLGLGYPVATEKAEEMDLLARSVHSARLKNNPVGLTLENLKEMYGRIVK